MTDDPATKNPRLDASSSTESMHGGSEQNVVSSDRTSSAATRRSEDYQYEIYDRKALGNFFIFNHEKYKNLPEAHWREGTNKDAEDLEKTAKELGFKTEMFKDRTVKQIFDIFKEYSDRHHDKNYSCFACAFLTHGRNGKGCLELRAYDHGEKETYDRKLQEEKCWFKLEDVFDCFTEANCTSLKEKPKLFFIQACRGYQVDSLQNPGPTDVYKLNVPDLSSEIQLCSSPEAHFFIAHSTLPDCRSLREISSGSIFIQELCRSFQVCLKNKAEFTLFEVSCRLNTSLAERTLEKVEENGQELQLHHRKQLASVTSQLTNDFCFKFGEPATDGIIYSSTAGRRHAQNLNYFFIFSSKRYNDAYGAADANNLAETGEKMGYICHKLSYNNKQDVFKHLKHYHGTNCFGNSSIFLFALLTVNATNGDVDTYDPSVGEILNKLSWDELPLLMNIPKILFFQACAPNRDDAIVEHSLNQYKAFPPPHADILTIHSRSSSYEKADDENCKSLFIDTLCEKMSTFQNEMNIVQIMHQVNQTMARKGIKEVPLVTSHLRQMVTLATGATRESNS